jgi:hypothetical protein
MVLTTFSISGLQHILIKFSIKVTEFNLPIHPTLYYLHWSFSEQHGFSPCVTRSYVQYDGEVCPPTGGGYICVSLYISGSMLDTRISTLSGPFHVEHGRGKSSII